MRIVQRRPSVANTQNRPICRITSGKEHRLDRTIVGQGPHSDQPGGVKEHNQQKVRPAILDAAGGEQSAFVLFGPPQLGDTLEREKTEKRRAPAEFDHSSTAAKYAEKPGPNAASKCRPHAPLWIARSRTNNTVAEDIFP